MNESHLFFFFGEAGIPIDLYSASVFGAQLKAWCLTASQKDGT